MLTQEIRDLISQTAGPSLPAEDIRLQYAHFDGNAKLGKQIVTTFAEWVESRARAAREPWPDPNNKNALPAERGAILAQSDDDPDLVRGRNEDVCGLTWLFVDCDDGTSPVALRLALAEADICYLLTESATSRLNGAPLKWHLILPFDDIVNLPSRGGLTDQAAAEFLTLHTQWWQSVRQHVIKLLFALGGIPDKAADPATNDLTRKCFIPHQPIDGAERYVYSRGGRCINLRKLLAATGFAQPDPPGVGLLAAPKPIGEVKAQQVKPTTAPTPGQTTGSLVKFVLEHEGLLGPHQGGGRYFALCPWREDHTAHAGHNPESFDSSVMMFLTGGPSGDGGFNCKHKCQAGAAKLLSWARRKGIPLPERGVGGIGASEIEAAEAACVEAACVEATAANAESDDAEKEVKAMDAVTHASPTLHAIPKVVSPSKPKRDVTLPSPTAFPHTPATPINVPVSPAHAPVTSTPTKKVEIEITEDLIDMRDKSIYALSLHESFYKINGKLFDRVKPDDALDKNGKMQTPWMRKTLAPHLTVEILRTSSWFKSMRTAKSVERVPARPDSQVIGTVLAAGNYPGVRELRGIVHTPVFRRDGSLLSKVGYDPGLHVLYEPGSIEPDPIPTVPSREQCAKALADLRYVLVDFPFTEPDLAFSVWLSAIFTRLMRFAFSGNIPALVVSAGMAGSGKGKLPDTAAIISEGVPAEKRGYTGDDAEDERVIGTVVADEIPIAVLDNIARGTPLASTAFEMYLTTPKFATRKIGTSESIRVEKGTWADTLWWATGNDLTTSGDMARRILKITINDKTGKPEDRETSETDLEGYCQNNRKRLLGAALTLLAGFYAARNQHGWKADLPPFASFEDWSIVRQAVVWCGLPDPYLARGKVSDDAVRADFGYTVEHLRKLFGKSKSLHMKRIVDILRTDSAKAATARQYDDVWSFFIDRGVKLDGRDVSGASIALGRFLKDFNGQVYVGADGKRWQFLTSRDRGGSLVTIEEA